MKPSTLPFRQSALGGGPSYGNGGPLHTFAQQSLNQFQMPKVVYTQYFVSVSSPKLLFQLNESPTSQGLGPDTGHNGLLAHNGGRLPNGHSGHAAGDHHRILPHSLTHTARRTLPQPPGPNSHLPLKPPTSINSYGLSDFFSRTNRDFDWIWHSLVLLW